MTKNTFRDVNVSADQNEIDAPIQSFTNMWIQEKEKVGISQLSLCMNGFCLRHEAACQDNKTRIYLSDLNSKSAPSFRLISTYASFFFPSTFLQTSTILGLMVSQCVCASSWWRGYIWGFLFFFVLFFWHGKLPSYWDSKRPTRHSMLLCTGPEI